MTSNSQPAAIPMAAASSGMRAEVETKWGKFSSAEIAALKDNNDLVAQVQSKYRLDKVQAQNDVDAFAKGRTL